MKLQISVRRILFVGLIGVLCAQSLGCFFGGPSWEMKDQKSMLSPEPGQAQAARNQLRMDLLAYLKGHSPELGHPPEAVAIYALHEMENGHDADAYALFSVAGYLSKKTSLDLIIKALEKLGFFSQSAMQESQEFQNRSILHADMTLLDLLKRLRFAFANRAVVRALSSKKEGLKEGEKISYSELEEISRKPEWYKPHDKELASAVVNFFGRECRQEDWSRSSWALLYASKFPEKRLLRALVEGPKEPLFPPAVFGIVIWGKQVIPPLLGALDENRPEQTANVLVALALLEAREEEPKITAAIGSSSNLYIRLAYSFYRVMLGFDPPENYLGVLKEAEKNLGRTEKKRDEIVKNQASTDAQRQEAYKVYWKDHDALDQGLALLETLFAKEKIKSVPTFFLIKVMQHNHPDFWDAVANLMIRQQVKLSDDEFDLVVNNLKQIDVGTGSKGANAAMRFGLVLSLNKQKLDEMRRILGESRGRNGQRLALFWAVGAVGEDGDFPMLQKEFKPSLKGYSSRDAIREISAFNQAIIMAAGNIGCAQCRRFLMKTAKENPLNLGGLAVEKLLKFRSDPDVSAFMANLDVSVAGPDQLRGKSDLRAQALRRVMEGLRSTDFEELNEATSLAKKIADPKMKPAVERLLAYEGDFPKDKYIRNDAIELMAVVILAEQNKQGAAKLREVISVIDTSELKEARRGRRAKLEKALAAAGVMADALGGAVSAATEMAQGAESGSLDEDEAKAMVLELVKSAERTTESAGAAAGGEDGAAAEQVDKAGAGAEGVKAEAAAAKKAQCDILIKELKEVKGKCDAGKKIYCEAFGEKRDEFIKKCGKESLPAELAK